MVVLLIRLGIDNIYASPVGLFARRLRLNRINHFNHHGNCRDACCRTRRSGKGAPDNDTVKLGRPSRDESEPLYGSVTISFDLLDDDAKRMDVDVRFSLDGHVFMDATPAPGSPSLLDLSSCPHGVRHEFHWNAVADLGPAAKYDDVLVLVAVHGGNGLLLAPMRVDNTLRARNDETGESEAA